MSGNITVPYTQFLTHLSSLTSVSILITLFALFIATIFANAQVYPRVKKMMGKYAMAITVFCIIGIFVIITLLFIGVLSWLFLPLITTQLADYLFMTFIFTFLFFEAYLIITHINKHEEKNKNGDSKSNN